MKVRTDSEFLPKSIVALRHYSLRTFGSDLVAGVTVGLVALPLLYVVGARQSGDSVIFPVEGIDGGSLLMLTVQVGT